MVLRDASASKKKYLSNSFISGTKWSRYLNWVKNLRLLVELIFEQVTPARSSGKCLGQICHPPGHKRVSHKSDGSDRVSSFISIEPPLLTAIELVAVSLTIFLNCYWCSYINTWSCLSILMAEISGRYRHCAFKRRPPNFRSRWLCPYIPAKSL